MSDLVSVNVNGTLGTVINCGYCNHTNPNQCPQCKPTGIETCIGCLYRGGGTPAESITYSPGWQNDPPIPPTVPMPTPPSSTPIMRWTKRPT